MNPGKSASVTQAEGINDTISNSATEVTAGDSNKSLKRWLDFIPLPNGKMMCERCGKVVGAQRIARGAHAAKCLKANSVHSGSNQGGPLIPKEAA